MAYTMKEGQGSLFKNDRKQKETHPDYKGSCLVNGVECWISAWIKEGAKGKWMSLAIAPKEVQESPAPAKAHAKVGSPADIDSDIPF